MIRSDTDSGVTIDSSSADVNKQTVIVDSFDILSEAAAAAAVDAAMAAPPVLMSHIVAASSTR